jgi:hypothetical protein
MRWLIASLALVLMTAAAQAQMNPQATQMSAASRIGQSASRTNDSDKDKVKVNDKAYNAALHNLPDKQYDPWHGVR